MKKRGMLMLVLLVILLPGMRAPEQQASFHFGLRIYPQNGFLVTTALVTVHNNKIVKQEIITRDQFVMMMSGVYESKANPYSKDLLLENGIKTCHSAIDSITNRAVHVRCPLFDEIWKVRYKLDIRKKNYFYGQNIPKEGWAGTDFFPSKAQFEYLKKTYGSDGCNEFIWGNNLIKFMKDISDSAWVSTYKALN